MSFRFPLKDVAIQPAVYKRQVENASYHTDYIRLNQNEFTLDIAGIGWFYAHSGNYVMVLPDADANAASVDLYLNGSVYGAILHQRKTLPLHGSCFGYRGLGIMICGDSGVGKSSLTTSFCLNGADFLTDDVTPILFRSGKPHIWGTSDRIKLWSDSLLQLNQPETGLERIFPEQGKFYFPMESDTDTVFPLNHVFILHIHSKPDVCVQTLRGVEKFTALRNEVYRREYLRGMPESESAYLEQLITLSQASTVTEIYRPADISIAQLQLKIETLILAESSRNKIIVLEKVHESTYNKTEKI